MLASRGFDCLGRGRKGGFGSDYGGLSDGVEWGLLLLVSLGRVWYV